MLRSRSLVGLLILVIVLKTAHSNHCLTNLEEVNPKRIIHHEGHFLNIQFEVSRRVTHRLTSEIMKIFLTEVLGYTGIGIINKDDKFNASEVFERLSEKPTYNGHKIDNKDPETMVNMEVWIPPQQDTSPLLSKYNVKECGSIAPPGHFGWFVPNALARPDDNWLIFSKLETASRFVIDEAIIKNSTMNPDTRDYYCHEVFCKDGMYIPEQCQSQGQRWTPKCALLLAEYPDVTLFVKEHIDQMKLYVKVAWVGPNLRYLTKNLTEEYIRSARNSSSIENRSLMILHYSPSSVIPNEKDFTTIYFPRCGAKESISCAYESNRLTKLVWKRLEMIAKMAFQSISRAKFSREMYENLIVRRMWAASNVSDEEIACDWLKENLNYTLTEWKPSNEYKNTLFVGGIFPMTNDSYIGKSIVIAAKMAKEVINVNNTLLRDYNLTLMANNGQCKSDMVMKSFINYIVQPDYYQKLVGVLGPACSETVEPLVGVSKHYKTVIISYSAEGSSFDDRSKYPYFFRTIGENKQYKYVYLQLLQMLGWHRVASLTEDGQKYTEYISYMQDLLRDNGITFVANVKFPREREADVMTNYLKDLKEKRARIIIADVYGDVALQVMCEAYKLEMTAAQGYVWFLPLWLQQQWYNPDYYKQEGKKVHCTMSEMMKAINGHLGLSHAYFARDDSIMQEGITVREWRERYENTCRMQDPPLQPSNYAGYAYDAMWTYAYAMDRLIHENESYVFDLHSDHTVNRLTTIIGESDFNGVSGRIQFLGRPSRYSVINIIQFIDNETRIVGNFYPNISEVKHEVIGGTLDLNISAFVWLSETKPDDGSEPPARCVLAGLAELLDVSCEVAIVIANIIGFGLLGAILIIGFIMIKRKYDEKVRQHEKYMKSLGIDLSQTDTSSLDVWEIPRDRVVINRKLGEGAFGTVYGGEAFFPDKGWLAVAVKTLKVGSSTDEKLDFLSEVEVMKRFEHKNIIRLLGVCIKCEPVLTVMEFMLYGDLKTFLLARRHLVNDRSYEDSDEISNKKLTAMALDVARALSYLAQLKYVHRDVASRNCLVNAQRVVKLGDFGMTRPMYENDYYKFNRKGMLPVRWMSPESLALGIFTPASDVWSYGVMLYEIVTFGSFPFQGMSNNEVLSHVKAGNCLTVPKKVKMQLENLMYSCWNVDHTKRPSAPEIVDFLATNPRIIAPCLDVPLSSVQLEHTAQLDIQLSENNRKFSISWPSQRSDSQTQELKSPNSPTSLLLDLNGQDDDQTLDSLLIGISSEQDSSSPLLDSTRASILKQMWLQENSNDNQAHRYVNLQPGMLKLACESGRNGSAGNIQMEEKTSILSEKKSTDNMSVL
ncbi:Insulin-like peptide receptor [Camponotus floridanus]|uniref:Gamma-aminobutyric acid type B receptor subunit 2 n=1 Tax=Camponotus floridanus TaxID=104421 RepID=E2A036_CAMFO|nr:uncharacterized protein LOC105258817 [Camponotus floridanus]XP_011268631.1 uncharacterized protein LOC105258817 [Camponotus floridanus]XP_019885429.1 uncharacterized protein LOC105258817 [Camponotus floridanus]EFN73169.1 Insulin-like peptide receptor [Camponotus floridanus]